MSRRCRFAFLCALALHGASGVVLAKEPRPAGVPTWDAARLIDQDGHPMALAALRGQLVVINFVFTGCSATCPVQTRELVQVQQALPPSVRTHVRFVSVSIDPRNDTPAALKVFARAQGVDLDRWSFVTGDPEVVDALATGLEALAATPSAANHSTDIRLLDRRGRLAQRYAGVPVDRARLVREIRALHDAAEAPSAAASSPAHTSADAPTDTFIISRSPS